MDIIIVNQIRQKPSKIYWLRPRMYRISCLDHIHAFL